MTRSIQGIKHHWLISNDPIGSGDAGEVYAVTSLEEPELTGVMKKPAKKATIGTIQRQAAQIAQETKALTLLNGLPNGKAHPPRLLDHAPEYTLGTANYFMVSETAPGDALTTILSNSRQLGKPFPRRVIIAVLDALFDLFSNAHRIGVLWNDVKLDHIFWHNSSEQVGVIDWGNALFLDKKVQQTPPRWEDYQQLAETMGSFLQTAAPELYDDLGWGEFQAQALNASQVSVLAKRISYQQEVIAHQVMEYQSLIRVELNEGPSMDGLQKISRYQDILTQIGADWEEENVLSYCKSLVELSLAENNSQNVISSVILVWQVFDNNLDLSWHLVREFCQVPEIISHTSFQDLIRHTLNNNWYETLWTASLMASQIANLSWWEKIMPILRQTTLGNSSLTPYQACKKLQKWAQDQNKQNLTEKLNIIVQSWRFKGSNLKESPFAYDLLDLLRYEHTLHPRLRLEIKQIFNLSENIIRTLENAWTNADWEPLASNLKIFISWDPDRWGIFALHSEFIAFQNWLNILHRGPQNETDPFKFLYEMSANRPKLEHLLGTPSWLLSLIKLLQDVLQSNPVIFNQSIAQQFCPWLLVHAKISQSHTETHLKLDPAEVSYWLSEFLKYLKNWSDVDVGLLDIQIHAPQIYPVCNSLANVFNSCLSLIDQQDQTHKTIIESIPSELHEAIVALESLASWRECIRKNDLPGGLLALSDEILKDWMLIKRARHLTMEWETIILPSLESILTFEEPGENIKLTGVEEHKKLIQMVESCSELKALWLNVYVSGVHADFLNAIVEIVDTCRISFIAWQKDIESEHDLITRLLYHSQIAKINQVYDQIAHFLQNINQAAQAFTLLQVNQQAVFAVQGKYIANTLHRLALIEQKLIFDTNSWQFPGFSKAFKDIDEAPTTEKRNDLISVLPENHPFYAWLVKSTRN